MFEEYLNAGMHLAKYELLEGDEGFYAEIPAAPGVWANAATLEECRDILREALEEWVLLGISLHHELPVFGDARLNLPYQHALEAAD
ncbi:MAG: type II toxin-antitoxin system HicB family antitoxin [Pleurocapsa sp. SU_196_0]|nr:type II toxin-antitoxin system HicB family antitoxin [Pleurocapsa sp. SU_196_0]